MKLTDVISFISPPSEWCVQLNRWESSIQLDKYRSSELRNILIQKLHVPANDVNKLIDMNELRKSSLDIIDGIKASDCPILTLPSISPTLIAYFFAIFIASFLLLSNRRIQKWFVSLDQVPYSFRVKYKVMSRGLRKRRFYVAGLAFLALAMDVAIKYIQISVIASFIIPYSWRIRQYLFFGPSLPITTSMFAPGGGNSSSSYGLNLGPMVMIFLLGKLISYLEEKIAINSSM